MTSSNGHSLAPQARPRDVAYVLASMITGGTQTHLLQVFRFLDRARYRPHLFCLRDGGNLVDAVRTLDVPLTSLGMYGSLRHPGDVRGLLRMRGLLRALDPAVVHGYLLRGSFFGAVAAKMAGVDVMVTSKRDIWKPASAAERFAERTSNGLSTVITGNSPAVCEYLRGAAGAAGVPTEMIPSGIDVDRFDPERCQGLRESLGLRDEPVVGTAITFRPCKGYRLLFEAFARVRQRFPAARLLFAGEGEFPPEPAAVAEELGIMDAITLLGRRRDMPEVLATFDVFVLPSDSEGMSNALLEAMAMRLPVVATDVGGNPAVVDEGVSGHLVPYPDEEAMASRICELLEDPARRAAMGEQGRARVTRDYSAASMVDQMEAMYDRFLEARR